MSDMGIRVLKIFFHPFNNSILRVCRDFSNSLEIFFNFTSSFSKMGSIYRIWENFFVKFLD